MTRKWVVKPVNFDRTNDEEMKLYEFARSLPNFTVMTKNWLRSLRDSQPTPLYDFISRQPVGLNYSDQEYVDCDGDQFL